ncbi:MAG: ATP-binding protein [Bacteroidota bacterium]
MKQIRLIVSDLTQIYFHDLALQRCTSLLEREIKFTIFSLLVLSSLIFPSILLGQQEIGRPIGEYFDQSSFPGAAENFSVAEDDHGVLYFGNASGVLEFDGQSWELITTNNNSSVYSLDVSDNNTVFVGSKGEFGYLKPDSTGKLMYASLASHIPDHHKAFGEVWETLCTPVGVYFRTTKKVFRWDPTNSFLQVWALDEAGEDMFHHAFYVNGKLLIYVIGKGLMEVEGQTLKMVRGGEKLRNTVVNVILPFPGGDPGSTQLLICSRNQGLFYYDGARFIPFPVDIDRVIRREQGYIYHGTSLPNGDIALSTYENGIYILSPGGVLNTYLEKNRDLYGGRARFIYSSNKSTTRNVWIALDNGLLLTEIPSPFTQYDANDGLSLPLSQLVRSEGTLYAISRTGVFQHRFTSRLSLSPTFLPVRGLEEVHYNSYEDSPNGLLIGTEEGLFQIRNRRAYVVGNDSTMGVHVLNNNQEVLLAATSKGVQWYTQNGNDWRLQGRIEGLPADVKDIIEFGDGSLLMSSTQNGLYRTRYSIIGEENTDIEFTPQQVSISGSLDANNISLTFLDKTRQILVISPNLFGIHSFNPSSRELLPLLSQEQIAASNPIWASNQISGLSEDLSGNVWAYSTSNIAQLIPKPGGGFEINTTDRLSNMGANGIFHDLNRDIWIANVDGVLRKADATPPLADQPSLTVIRKVTLNDGKSVFQDNSFYPLSLADSTIRISPDESSIEFTFSATKPSFITEWQFQYFLEGLDDTWSTPTDNNSAIYANLEPGNYLFKVRAFDDRGVMSQEETVALVVNKFWYQQMWAIALFVLAGLLVLAGIFLLVRFLLKKRQSSLASTFRKQQKSSSRPGRFSFRENKTKPVPPQQTPEIPVDKLVEVNEPKIETEEQPVQNPSWITKKAPEKEEPKPVVAEAKEIIAEKEEIQVVPESEPQSQPQLTEVSTVAQAEATVSAEKKHEQEILSFMAKFDQLGKLLLEKPDTSTLHLRLESILNEFISFDIYGYGMPSSDHPGMDFRYKVHSNHEIISLTGNGQVPDPIAEWSLIRKEALLIGDVASEYGKFAQTSPPEGMLTLNGNNTPPPRSMMYVPLHIQNQARGYITLQSFLPNTFREYHLQILQNLGNYLSLYLGGMEGNSSVEAMQKKVYQQDKMASLGELTKGLTREIGSPTSYIAKNIKALKQNLTEASDVWYEYECLSPEDAVAQLKDIERMKSMKDYDKKVADIFDYAQNVLKGAHRIAEILKGIKTYIGQEDDLKTINIHPNLDSALLILRHLYKGRIKITRDYGNIPEVPCFPAKLNQAFINVLVNAIKSIDGQGDIYVQTIAEGNHVQINIRDTGRGISEEDKQHLFEPFIHMDHGLNGSRVGLALTKDIILLHQGTIEVDSQPGAGTMFKIQLPTRLNLSMMYGNS